MRQHRYILLPLLAFAVALASLPAATIEAQNKKAAKKRARPAPAAVKQARQLLRSGDRSQVEAGIQSLGLLGTPQAVDPLVVRIRAGLPADLLETAIVTLMALGQPKAGPVLHELTSHRRATIRLRAVEALAAVDPPGAEATLLAVLSDSDPDVRAAAAAGLGDVGSPKSLETLFHALDMGNFNASGAIGKLVKPGQVTRLLGYIGDVPFSSLGPALGEVLKRKDIPEDKKLEIVARLEEMGTGEVKRFLGDLMSTSGEVLPQRVSRAVLRAMQEIAQ